MRWIVIAPGTILAGLIFVERFLIPGVWDAGSLFTRHLVVDELAVIIALGVYVMGALLIVPYAWIGSAVSLVALAMLLQAGHRVTEFTSESRVVEFVSVVPVREMFVSPEYEDGAVYVPEGIWVRIFGGPQNEMRVFRGRALFALKPFTRQAD